MNRIRRFVRGAPSPREQFEHLTTVSGKFEPHHDRTGDCTVVYNSEFTIGPSTRPEDIPVPDKPLCHQASPEVYINSGRANTETMIEVLEADGFTLLPGGRVLDLGCLTGRMMRWLLDHARNGVEIWGADINSRAINWSNGHLSPPFHFVTTTTHPHLPFPDKHFDLIYAGSVFTHMGDLADAWLLELSRVMRPSGRAYLSFNDEDSIKLLKENHPKSVAYTKYVEGTARLGITLKEVCSVSVDLTPYSRVYYNTDYLSEKLSRWFKLKTVKVQGFGWQSCYLVEKSA